MGAGPTNSRDVVSRRDAVKLTGLAIGGLVAGAAPQHARASPTPSGDPRRQYSYMETLPDFDPSTPLAANEMRISFMGSCIPPVRRAQQMMSVFVEVGWVTDPANPSRGRPRDQFIFDCGSGVCANYGAMGVGYGRMDKVFINHLHGDHMSDLTHIYCFGPSADRKSPLYVWGPGPSGVPAPRYTGGPSEWGLMRNPAMAARMYDDGVKAYCRNLREAMRWHTESFSFQSTSYKSYVPPTRQTWGLPVDPVPVGDDPRNDAYAMVPIELNWTRYGRTAGDNVAYANAATGARVTHFPVIHCRKGSIGYKLEWNGLSMIYTSDTKPEQHSVRQAVNGGKGVDVFIHEMVPPAEVWAYKNMGLDAPGDPNDPMWVATLQAITDVQNSSHTPQGAFGYLMSQIRPRPKLTVATHFPVADDTVESALQSVRNHVPDVRMGTDLIWSFDLMVLRVFPDRVEQVKANVNDYGFSPPAQGIHLDSNVPKYHTPTGSWDAYAQIDTSAAIPAVDPDTHVLNYRVDGY